MDNPIKAAGNAKKQPVYGKMIQAEFIFPKGDKLWMAKFRGRAVGPDGKTIGTFHDTPIFNSVVYYVDFPDGEIKEYTANVIAEKCCFKLTMWASHSLCWIVSLTSNRMSRLSLKTPNMQPQSVEADV